MHVDINAPLSIDTRVDDYVRGKMSDEDALNFEAEYLENPELLEQVELADRLREGLRENLSENLDESLGENKQKTHNNQEEQHPIPIRKFNLFKYLAVPQTAWGAIAAAILMYPVVMLNNNIEPTVNTAVYVLNQSVTRGEDENTRSENIVLDKTTKNLVLGFKTPSTLGVPQQYRLNIYDHKNMLLWQGENLVPNAALVIYVDIDRSFLQQGNYQYRLEKSNDNNTIGTGNFNITRS